MKKRVLIALACAGAVALLLALVVGAEASPDALTLVSGAGSDMVAVSSDGSTYGPSAPAVLTWKHGSWPLIPDAAWISSAYYVEEPVNDSWREFTRTFELCPGAYNMSGSIQVTSDNAEIVMLNGNVVGSDGEVYGPFVDNHEWQTILTYDLTGNLQPGTNTLVTVVRNYAQSGGSQTSNPTGLIYKADITYDCPIQVEIDIKPGSCPNPLNTNSKGVLPIAVLGTDDFDVTTIDPPTIRLTREGYEDGVSPLRWSYEDVGTPFEGELCECHDLNGDGYLDLTLKFSSQELTDTLDLEGEVDNTIPLLLTGSLKEEAGGTPIEGSDCVWVLGTGEE